MRKAGVAHFDKVAAPQTPGRPESSDVIAARGAAPERRPSHTRDHAARQLQPAHTARQESAQASVRDRTSSDRPWPARDNADQP